MSANIEQIEAALKTLGHEPGLLMRHAQAVADMRADAEMRGCSSYLLPHESEARGLSTYLPTVWKHVTAGHHGGGGHE
jgi:hypothetical protein